jgi:hypothetical protein
VACGRAVTDLVTPPKARATYSVVRISTGTFTHGVWKCPSVHRDNSPDKESPNYPSEFPPCGRGKSPKDGSNVSPPSVETHQRTFPDLLDVSPGKSNDGNSRSRPLLHSHSGKQRKLTIFRFPLPFSHSSAIVRPPRQRSFPVSVVSPASACASMRPPRKYRGPGRSDAPSTVRKSPFSIGGELFGRVRREIICRVRLTVFGDTAT